MCISDIRQWMSTNFLCLNDDKTEVLLVGSKHSLQKLSPMKVRIGDVDIIPVSEVRNIGLKMDSALNMHGQINQVCRNSWFQLRRISQIRQYLDFEATKKIIHSFVTSRIDNLNSLLYGVPSVHLKKLRRVQYASARIILLSKEQWNLLPLLKELHWLPIMYRIHYKLLLLTFKALNGLGPQYLSDLLQPVTSTHRVLRSSSQNLLIIPFSKSVTYADRSFSVAAPTLWNAIPADLRASKDIKHFKKSLKTHLFTIAFKNV